MLRQVRDRHGRGWRRHLRVVARRALVGIINEVGMGSREEGSFLLVRRRHCRYRRLRPQMRDRRRTDPRHWRQLRSERDILTICRHSSSALAKILDTPHETILEQGRWLLRSWRDCARKRMELPTGPSLFSLRLVEVLLTAQDVLHF